MLVWKVTKYGPICPCAFHDGHFEIQNGGSRISRNNWSQQFLESAHQTKLVDKYLLKYTRHEIYPNVHFLWRLFWNSKWWLNGQSTQLEPTISGFSTPKLTKLANKNIFWCRNSENMIPYGFSMVAILIFKMAAEDVVEKIGTNFFLIQHPKFIKVCQKNQQWCRKSQNMVPYAFSMAAILKFKMAAEDVVKKIGTKVFLDSEPPNWQS